MVGAGMLMLLVGWASVFQLKPWKNQASTLPAARGSRPREGAGLVWGGPALAASAPELPIWHARVLVAMTFTGWVALIAGSYGTEVGCQPWLVPGALTASDAASKVTAPRIALTLSVYLTLYAALVVAYISLVFYFSRHKTPAHKPFGEAGNTGRLEDQLNVVNYPQNEGAVHA
jgi:cytochrome d ubiquinol oxidase subunit I